GRVGSCPGGFGGEALGPLDVVLCEGGVGQAYALDFAGPGRWVGVLDVAPQALDDVVAIEGVGAVQFHGVLGGLDGPLVAEVFRVDQVGVAGQALVEEVHGLVGEYPGGAQAGFHVADAVPQDGQVGQGGLVGGAGLEPGGGGVHDGFVDAEADGGQVGAAVEDAAALGHGQSLADLPDHVVGGDADVIEVEAAGGEAVQTEAGTVVGDGKSGAVGF